MNSVTEYLDIISARFPNKVSIVDENGEITFQELRDQAYLVAERIIGLGINKKPVVVYMGKSLKCIVSFMGIAYSGNFYCPIDVDMPAIRVNKIISTLEPRVVITDDEHYTMAKEIIPDASFLIFENVTTKRKPNNKEIACVDRVKTEIIDTDVLYVLFTSGSTGDPKGVIISHRAVVDYAEWVTSFFGINENDSFANQAPFYFDNSILDIYQMLKTGAVMHIVPPQLYAFPTDLLQYLKRNSITVIFWVPSALCHVANMRALNKNHVDSLRMVLFCGEVMPNKQLNQWRAEYKDVLFANLYGPTEITDACSVYVVNRDFEDSDPLPIGFPCANTDIMVLKTDGELVVGDEKGELCVRGTCLSYGYYNNFDKTAASFIQNPQNPYYKEIVYKTGDLVHYNELGELMYDSRIDFQIKHMGHRIELGEIENAASAVNGINSCCCVYDDKKMRIVLFFAGNADDAVVADELKRQLPQYMIPGKRIRIDKMPLNANGKIDRLKLRESVK